MSYTVTEKVRERARKGAQALIAKHGVTHLAKIGRKGGLKVSRDRTYMSVIAKRGVEARKAKAGQV